jgi:pyruvate formate lyase activating enzyme
MKKEAMLYEALDNGSIKCGLCAHECVINDGKTGICGVRQTGDGKLYTLVYGEAIAASVDPIEKKPLYHIVPGSGSYSIATIGCNFKCDFCQNWQISQASKGRDGSFKGGYHLLPQEVVSQAVSHDCKSIAYTYTEPTIYFEYAFDTAKLAHEKGILNVFVTNGFMSRGALESISPYLDAANVDLKSFRDRFYKRLCGGWLQPVLDSIRLMRELGVWVEVTSLLIPGQNDSDKELQDIAGFISETDQDIPWHISRYHPDYKFDQAPPTSLEALYKARAIGERAGLKYIYLGNVAEGNDTVCPQCKATVINRSFYDTRIESMNKGECGKCGGKIAGIWQVK